MDQATDLGAHAHPGTDPANGEHTDAHHGAGKWAVRGPRRFFGSRFQRNGSNDEHIDPDERPAVNGESGVDASVDKANDTLTAGSIGAGPELDSDPTPVGTSPILDFDVELGDVSTEPAESRDAFSGPPRVGAPVDALMGAPTADPTADPTAESNIVLVDPPAARPAAVVPPAVAPVVPAAPPPPPVARQEPLRQPAQVPVEQSAPPGPGVFVDPDSTAEILKRPQRPARPLQQPVAVRRPPKTRVRRVTRVVRHVDTWSVFKIAGVFNLFMLIVLLTTGVLLWQVAVSTGTIDNVERGFENVGWEVVDLKSKGGEIFHNAWIAGLFIALGLTGLAVMMATLFNLITDLVGGMRVTVLEEEIRTRDERQQTVIPQAASAPLRVPGPSGQTPPTAAHRQP